MIGNLLKTNLNKILIVCCLQLISCDYLGNNEVSNNDMMHPSDKMDYFYDFEFKLDVIEAPVGLKYEIVYDWLMKSIDKDSMKVVHCIYVDSNDNVLKNPIKVEYIVNKAKMNRIYSIITGHLTPTPLDNIYYVSNNYLLNMGEWTACNIEFSVGRSLGRYYLKGGTCNAYSDVLKVLEE